MPILQGTGDDFVPDGDSWQTTVLPVVPGTFYGIANLYYEFMGGTRVDVAGVPLSAKGDRLWGGLGVGGSVGRMKW